MNPALSKSLGAYDASARALAVIYNRMAFEDVNQGLPALLPDAYAGTLHALDLGCGSGRDARWLAERCFQVVAFDGAPEMVAVSREINPHPGVTYLHDFMPDMSVVKATGLKFDVMLMSAAWMHLDEEARYKTFENMTQLANPGALMFISLRHGPSPEDRPMFKVTAEELIELSRLRRCSLVHRGLAKDGQGRSNVSWEYVAFRV